MAFTVVQYKRFAQAQIPGTNTTLYTVPAATQDVIKSIDIVNASPSGTTISVFVVPSGGAAGPSNAIYYQQTLTPSQQLHWAGTQVMNAGDQIVVVSGAANACTITISGLEAT